MLRCLYWCREQPANSELTVWEDRKDVNFLKTLHITKNMLKVASSGRSNFGENYCSLLPALAVTVPPLSSPSYVPTSLSISIFQTETHWPWVFPHRMRISSCKKAPSLFFGQFFWTFTLRTNASTNHNAEWTSHLPPTTTTSATMALRQSIADQLGWLGSCCSFFSNEARASVKVVRTVSLTS